MTNEKNKSLRQWLRAERAGHLERAEIALREAFRQLSDPSPSLRFVDIVMFRLLPRPRREQIPVGWRALLTTSLALVALSVAVLPLLIWPLTEVVRLSSVIDFAASVVLAASQALAGWLSFWQSLGEANRVFFTIVSKPPVAATMLAVAGLGAVAIRFLSGLRALDRSVHDV